MEKESLQPQETTKTILEVEKKADFLNDQIKISLEDLHRHRKANRKKAAFIKITTLLFSSVATVLLGMQINGLEKVFKSTAFILAATVTLLSALEPFFNFRALWVEHEQAIARIYRLKNDVDFYLAGKKKEEIDADKLEAFLTHYQDIWNSLNDNYIKFRRSESQS